MALAQPIAAGDLHDTWRARTPRSAALFERATRVLPGGSTRTTVFAPPYPPYLADGTGIQVRDVDGNTYRDFLGNYTSLILGHAHPAVVAAVERQVRRGSAFGAPSELEIELAEELCRRVDSIERLRFTNSGTEATMFAIRAARAVTGRTRIGIFDRSYHGTHDTAVVTSPGVPPAVGELVITLPWDDLEGVERAIAQHATDLAAIVIEPIQGAGGVRAASVELLRGLREICDRVGALLIFDEVISFRAAPGGAQSISGVHPDLTTLGKIIGGGYPLAAFGGAADVMDRFDARRTGALTHGGTFNGNPVGAAAGLATLAELTPGAYGALAARADRLRAAVAGAASSAAVEVRVDTAASLFQIRLGDHTAASAVATGTGAADLFVRLLLAGFYLAPRGMGAIATPATDEDVDALAAAVVEAAVAIERD
ncbi:MAG TPA: aminotransferase class III-fold pyridoxal phosphate-dependent enzyme [Candidatus Limnocylindrales bacterium]|nr:aminotransferase class III-fold pyridoxal phosphate-dependent enzyme [Candidatus Limnocylindrales bacterium]